MQRLCGITFSDHEADIEVEKHGYVPRNLGIGGGDYVRLTIDVDSGQILGWNYPDNEIISEEMDKM